MLKVPVSAYTLQRRPKATGVRFLQVLAVLYRQVSVDERVKDVSLTRYCRHLRAISRIPPDLTSWEALVALSLTGGGRFSLALSVQYTYLT